MIANVRNLSEGGAMIDGLWNIPVGGTVEIEFAPDSIVTAKVRWSRENRIGVEFHESLRRASDGSLSVLRPARSKKAVAASA